jgi:hypothetical protein
MATLLEGKHAFEQLASEGNGTISRDVGVLISGQNLVAGSVLGKITASGKYTLVNPAAGTGEQVAVAILGDNVNATAGDTPCPLIARMAEVVDAELNWAALTTPQKVTARAQLAAVPTMIVCRWGGRRS